MGWVSDKAKKHLENAEGGLHVNYKRNTNAHTKVKKQFENAEVGLHVNAPTNKIGTCGRKASIETTREILLPPQRPRNSWECLRRALRESALSL